MRDEVKKLYETTDLTLGEIGEVLDLSRAQVDWIVNKEYSVDYRKNRKRQSYRNSKLGNKNPSYGLKRELSPSFKGEISDGKGYILVLKPDWYTGRRGCKHIFKHHEVMCKSLGITEIPKGWCVHHIDHDKTNNNLINLSLQTVPAHTRLHQLERATTRGNS